MNDSENKNTNRTTPSGGGGRKSSVKLMALHPAITVVLLAIVIALAFLAVQLLRGGGKQPVDQGDSIPTYVNLELPDPMMVSDPLMKDFINGSFGYQCDYEVTKLDPFFLVCYRPDDSRKMWVSYYSWGEKIVEPPLGTDPNQNTYELAEAEQQVLADHVQSMSKEMVLDAEEGWRILVVQSYLPEGEGVNPYDRLDSAGRFAGMQMQGQFDNMTLYGNMYVDVYVDGYGWPTEYLRKKPFCDIEAMKQWNMKDEFWDEYRLHQVLKFYLPGANEQTDVPLKAEVIYIDTFKVVEPGKQPLELHRHQLDILLESRGYVDHVEETEVYPEQYGDMGADMQ